MNMTKFEEFWQNYPCRKGKGAAAKKYEKIDADTHKSILLAIDAQKRHRQAAKKTGEFMPDWCMPATWLNQQRWLDEIPSHQDTVERTALGECSMPDCPHPVYGQRFNLCEFHLQFDRTGHLRGEMRLVKELREHYQSHPGIHNLRGKAAVDYIKNCIREMVK